MNTKGELIGINTAIYSETGNYAGYSFAVPISIAGKIASDLKQYGAVQRAVLGVQIIGVGDIIPVEYAECAGQVQRGIEGNERKHQSFRRRIRGRLCRPQCG